MHALLAAVLIAATLPLPAPPAAGTAVASTLRDALLAIERAQTTNPTAAQTATFTYDAALAQYSAREYEQARASALAAMMQAAAPPAPAAAPPHAPFVAPAFPGPRYYLIPDELPATAANAQKYVVLAHRAMAGCAAPKTADLDYRAALAALNAKQYRIAMADSRNIVDDCAAR